MAVAPVTGNLTTTVYTLIKERRFDDAIRILSEQLETFPHSRAALSLLGYCRYNAGQFDEASTMYERLTRVCPDVDEYRVYHAQALYKCGKYPEALKVASLVDSEGLAQRMHKLRAVIKYEAGELPACKAHLDKCLSDDADAVILSACVLAREGKSEEAAAAFDHAVNIVGFRPDLAYNVALCCYNAKQPGPALNHIAKIIERGIQLHPELSIGANTENIDVRSVGNSVLMRDTALVEAFNLKAAIEYAMRNATGAREALSDMPPRLESELDPITLHNSALIYLDERPTESIEKLKWLLASGKFPPETFPNLLLVYVKFGYFDLAADVLAENTHLWASLPQDLHDYLEARITARSSPAEAYRKLELLSTRHVDHLRRLMKQIQDEKERRDRDQVREQAESLRVKLREFDDAVERYIPVLMSQAGIYWEQDHYAMVEKLLRQAADFAGDHEAWKLNFAHTFYMQDGKFRECIRYYEPIVEKHYDNVLACSAIVLANLCVSFVMVSENDKAEDLMRRVEREEEKVIASILEREKSGGAAGGGGPVPPYPVHLCIINLVIGTLYCAKGNFDFGISRVIKSFEPCERKINADTWFYAKRCFLALGETLAKHMQMLKDTAMAEVLQFFDQADVYGRDKLARVTSDPIGKAGGSQATIQSEARALKRLFLRLTD